MSDEEHVPLSSGRDYTEVGRTTHIRAGLRGEAATDAGLIRRQAELAIARAHAVLNELDPNQLQSLALFTMSRPTEEEAAVHGPNAMHTSLVTTGTLPDIIDLIEVCLHDIMKATENGTSPAETDVLPPEMQL